MSTKPTADELARSFCAVLTEWLEADTIAEIVRRNAESANENVCHSHDFCDANQAMLDAMERHGMEWDSEHIDLVNAAWDIAKSKGFAV